MAKKKQAERSAPVENLARWSISDLLPYARNPKTHPPEQVELIAKSLAQFGQAQIVLIDGDEGPKKGEIIAGHGRVLAAEKLGWDKIIVGEAIGWTDEQKRAYRVMDNELGSERLAPYDTPKLRAELLQLQTDGFDIPLLGFSTEHLGELLLTTSDDLKSGRSAAPQLEGLRYAVIVRCDDEQHQVKTLNELLKRGLKCEALIS